MTPEKFVAMLGDISLPNVFNPYSQRCADHDLSDASAIRTDNLVASISRAIELRVDTIWIARDLGYRGGRRTGLALTDEANLTSFSKLYGDLPLRKATRGPAVAERTAAMVWHIIRGFERPIFPWNVFPLHPHEPGKPLTNRCHTGPERALFRPMLLALLDLLNPRLIVAIGQDAVKGLADLGVAATPVRHPSYGGRADFIRGLATLYGHRTSDRPSSQAELALE